jgi:protoheme IX farnesyltransferase
MLTVVRGPITVALQIVLYAWATLAGSLLLIPIASTGLIYAIMALGLGIPFVVESHRLFTRAINRVDVAPMRLFHYSNAYLAMLFVAVAIDALWRIPLPAL